MQEKVYNNTNKEFLSKKIEPELNSASRSNSVYGIGEIRET